MSATARRPRIGITTKQGGPSTVEGRAYAAAVEGAGGEVVWLEPQTVAGREVDALLREVDAIVLSGGVDVEPRHFGEQTIPEAEVEIDPARDAAELPLVRAALEQDVPVLGICRGIQMLNVAAGGTVHQDLGLSAPETDEHQQRKVGKTTEDVAHQVRIERHSRLGETLGAERLEVNSFHHQAVRTPAPGFVVTARSPDGVIEAVEDPARTFAVGVQWHPERMVGGHPAQRKLFAALIDAAKRRAEAVKRRAT